MADLTATEIGSIVFNMISDIPTGISGIMPTIVDQQRLYAEQFTGESIGTSIADIYQPAITSLAAANVLKLMESQGIGTKSVTIGELSITKGMVDSTSTSFMNDGIEKLKRIGERITFYQAWGG